MLSGKIVAYINNTIHDICKKFNTVLLGGFREPFATCILSSAKECEITACALFSVEVL